MIESGSGEPIGADFHAPRDGEAKEQYVAAVEYAAFLAVSYDGTEQKYRELMSALEAVEEFVRNRQDSLEGEGIYQKEVALAKQWQFAEVPLTISDLLIEAQESRNTKIKEGQANLLWKKMPGTILPPGKGEPSFSGSDEESLPYELKFEERLQELFGILQDIGVFTDDVIITEGVVDPSMMRRESYMCVEIPRLERMVLVCNQVGEATFIIKGNFSIETLSKLSKEELLNKYPGQVERIVRTSFDNWKKDIIKHLLEQSDEGSAIKTKEKIDIHSYEELRDVLKAKYTPEWWVSASESDIRSVEIAGKKISALANIFGVDGNPAHSRYYFLIVGQMVWGTDEPIIKKVLGIEMRAKEQWVEEIKKRFITEQWVILKTKDRENLRIDGKSLKELATILRISGNPRGNFVDFLKLGQAIWGADEPIIKKALEVEMRTKQEWATEIKDKYTSENWVSMTLEERKALEIDGYKLSALSNVFVTGGYPIGVIVDFFKLGQAIWGADEPIIKKALEVEMRTKQEWAIEIQKKFSSKAWVEIKDSDKRSIRIDGKTLAELATIFGSGGVPRSVFLDLLKLGQAIWGAEEPIIKKALEIEQRTPEEWAGAVRKKYSTEEWVKKNVPEKNIMEIDGIKLSALAGILGITGQPVGNRMVFLKLGQAIWGTEEPIIKKALEIEQRTPEEWRVEIKKYYTPQEWVAMKERERQALEIDGRKIIALAVIFGISGNLSSNMLVSLKLGQAIWGADEPIIKKALEVEMRTKQEWATEIQKNYSPEEWLGLSKDQRIGMEIDGKKISALATIFGIRGEVRGSRLDFLRLCQAIWGSENPVIKEALKKY